MTDDDKTARFLALHGGPSPLLIPNPWDAGSARLLASMGYQALATTSSGFAATLGLLDGAVGRDAALSHSADIVAATELPVSADLENGFGDHPDEVAATARGAVQAGLAGFSIEDFTGDSGRPIYDLSLACERIAAAAEVAHGGDAHVVLTGRCENHLHGRDDLDDTIARLRAYEQAGADVLYAPGLTSPEQIAAVVQALNRPVNVLARPAAPTVSELAELGVSRISVGGAFAFAAIAAVVRAGEELRQQGTYEFARDAAAGVAAAKAAFQG